MMSILALILLTTFAAMGVAYMASINNTVLQADSQSKVQNALLSAESGLSFLSYQMGHSGVSGSLRGQALLDSLGAKLRTGMNGSPTLGGGLVTYDGTTITVPNIALAGGRTFSAIVTLPAYDTLRLTVVGNSGAGAGQSATTVQRKVSMDFHPTWDQALGFGLCSKGPVALGMNTDLTGLVVPSDGSVYSSAPGVAVDCGSGHISGDVSMSAPGATASLGGTTVDGKVIYNAPPVTMPVIDRTPYKNIPTTIMNLANPPSGTYKNIRIPANTNPSFANNVTILGLMYIEAPNVVNFGNSVTFRGVMVADDPPVGSPDTANAINFNNDSNNSIAFSSVATLPDVDGGGTSFVAVKKLAGSEILCPGFTMYFKNNLSSVGGVMALKALNAKNNVDSTLYGSLLIYGSAGLDFKNNSDLSISLSGSAPPPGFKGYGMAPLAPDPATYSEK